MAGKEISIMRTLHYICIVFYKRLIRSIWDSNPTSKFPRYPISSLNPRSSDLDFSNKTLIFNVEGALLKSSSLFPYFMLVAFEAGGLIRALILLLLYPLIWLVNENMGLKIMVMVSFLGIKMETFRVGRSVLPKFFLENTGFEGFEVLMKFGRKVGISELLPRVMIEGFLKDYLQVDFVIGRELKVYNGYYLGLMEDKKKDGLDFQEISGERKMGSDNIVGFGSFYRSIEDHYLPYCKEIYLVNEVEKKKWKNLPREKYPKPLVFHDGRLSFIPTPLSTLSMFIWIPFGILLFIFRFLVGVSLPYKVSVPLLAFSGMRLMQSNPNPNSTPRTKKKNPKGGILYVCNHRTLLDPIYLSGSIRKPLTAVTYSLSLVCELVAPIKTVRLTREREKDAEMMERMLRQGDVAVCPEGTTCREPYLLRFSPLFAEVSDEIIPVAIDVSVSMFYGTTASGFKFLDPVFFFMNPHTSYSVKFLEKIILPPLSSSSSLKTKSRIEVANEVQKEIGKALGFECTNLTRKDKYMILAGNEGIVKQVTTS